MMFPRYVFKDKGPYSREGGTYDSLLVANQNQYDRAIEGGWAEDIPAAINRAVPIAPEPSHPDTEPQEEDLLDRLKEAFED